MKLITTLLAGAFALSTTGLLFAPAEAAVPTCFGKSATIVGTAGPDSIVGTPGPDVIWAGAGDDSVVGEPYDYDDPASTVGAADLICGFTGNDTIIAGPGNDKVNGGDGHDRLRGEWGADVLQGNAGNDNVKGDFYDYEPGIDTGSGDVLRGHGGQDFLYDAGKETMEGGPGNDRLLQWWCEGGSTLRGGSGDDDLEAFENGPNAYNCPNSEPADYLYGDTGRDIADASKSDVVRTVEVLTRHSS